MKTCPNCDRENRDEAMFCAGCGMRLEETPSPERDSSGSEDTDARVCPSCGRSNKKDAKFCRSCGAILLSRTASSPSSLPVDRSEKARPRRTALWAGVAILLIAGLGFGGYVFWGASQDEPSTRASERSGTTHEREIDPRLGSLEIENRGNEPVRIFIEGQEIYTVPAEWSYVFHNLPLHEIDVRAVGERSGRDRQIGPLSIDAGGRYEVVLEP